MFFILTRERVVLKHNPTMSNPSDVLNHLRNDTLQGMETTSFYFIFIIFFPSFFFVQLYLVIIIIIIYLICLKQILYDILVLTCTTSRFVLEGTS